MEARAPQGSWTLGLRFEAWGLGSGVCVLTLKMGMLARVSCSLKERKGKAGQGLKLLMITGIKFTGKTSVRNMKDR